MTFDTAEPIFPNNAVVILAECASTLDDSLTGAVFRRPLRTSDPNVCIGVWGTLWTPDETSHEFRGPGYASSPGPSEPTIQVYNLNIQCLWKDTDEERGLAGHSLVASAVRTMLYHGTPLRVGLAALTVTKNSVTEKTTRWGIRRTRYIGNEIRGNWNYLSTTDVWLETETR